MDKLGGLLPKLVARQQGAHAVVAARTRIALGELLGPGLAGQIANVEVHGGKLSLATSNPALAHQLRLDSEAVLERLNALGVGRRLRELRVRIGA